MWQIVSEMNKLKMAINVFLLVRIMKTFEYNVTVSYPLFYVVWFI